MQFKYAKPVVWLLGDTLLMMLSFVVSAQLLNREADASVWIVLFAVIGMRCLLLIKLGCYRAILRYSGLHAMVAIASAAFVGSVVAMGLAFSFQLHNFGGLGRAFLLIEFLLTITLLGSARIFVRTYYGWRSKGGFSKRNVCIYGAGNLGEMTFRHLQNNEFRVIGFMDDDKSFKGRHIHGKQVFGAPEDLEKILEGQEVHILAVAIKGLSQARLKEVFHICMEHGVRVKVVQGAEQMLDGVSQVAVADLSMEDLLHRPRRNLDQGIVSSMLNGRVVLITGGGGSIGSEICRQVAAAHAKKIIILDQSEYNLYAIEGELRELAPAGIEIVAVLVSLLQKSSLEQVFVKHRPELVFHAAAYKHVPLVEANPLSGIMNNVCGLLNLLHCIEQFAVLKFVQISTDKAVRPTNVMGASKRVCELIVQNYPLSSARACAVRFGNVLGSSGSVIPRFLEQIKTGGPVTVTDAEMTRYFMLIPEAVELVLQSGALANQGEIFILDMGKPVKIVDLARQLIFMSGHIPDDDIKIRYTGLRPGEKMYEELIINDAEGGTPIEGVLIAKPLREDFGKLRNRVDALVEACVEGNDEIALMVLSNLVPEWTTPMYVSPASTNISV